MNNIYRVLHLMIFYPLFIGIPMNTGLTFDKYETYQNDDINCTIDRSISPKAREYSFLFDQNGNSSVADNSIEAIFFDQVDAFNNQDIDRLVKNVSADFKYFYLTSDELILEVEGKEEFRKSMMSYFGSGLKVHSEIKSHNIVGSKISFKEEVSHLNKEGKRVYSSALGIYEIKNNKITRSWYFID